MIYAFFLTILLVASAVLILAILMQAGKGGGLAANFGGAGSSSDSFLGSRQASNLLTKASWTAGGVFLALSFILSQMSARPAGAPTSILDNIAPTPPAPTAPAPSSSAPAPDGLNLTPNTGGAKAVEAKTAPAGKAGDAKAPTKVPPGGQ